MINIILKYLLLNYCNFKISTKSRNIFNNLIFIFQIYSYMHIIFCLLHYLYTINSSKPSK